MNAVYHLIVRPRKGLAAAILAFVVLCLSSSALAGAKNIILFIGDGMGFEHVRAAAYFAYGQEGTLSFERFPHKAEVVTAPAPPPEGHAAEYGGDDPKALVTDSAAGATAFATGRKVANGVLSVATPGDGQPLETILERLAGQGKRTGLVTTAVIEHATPAAFAAHQDSRGSFADVAADYLTGSRPNVLLGGLAGPDKAGRWAMTPEAARAAGYTVVTDRAGLRAVDLARLTHLSGQFGRGHMPFEYDYSIRLDSGYDTLPHLSEMVQAAMEVLSRGEDGFFLMVEGARIDHAGHNNDLPAAVMDTLEFAAAVKVARAWAAGREDTLIIVTADHETGGLKVLQNHGRGQLPTVSWSSTDHTGVNVPLYAWGANAHLFTGTLDNTEVHRLMLRALEAALPRPEEVGIGASLIGPVRPTRVTAN